MFKTRVLFTKRPEKIKCILSAFLVIILGGCKSNANDVIDLRMSYKPKGQAAYADLGPKANIDGSSLKIVAIQTEATKVSTINAIRVTAMKDPILEADFVRLWVCDAEDSTNCSINRETPLESPSGVFFVYQIPTKNVSFYAIACADTKALIASDEPCGPVYSLNYTSSKFPLNNDKDTDLLHTLEDEHKNIVDACREIYSALDVYLATDSDKKIADLEKLASTQSQLSNEQICAEYMASIDIPPSSPTSPPHSHFLIAMSLGSLSVLSLAAGIHGNWKLYKDIQNAKKVGASDKPLATAKPSSNPELESLERELSEMQTNLQALENEIAMNKQLAQNLEPDSSIRKAQADFDKMNTQMHALVSWTPPTGSPMEAAFRNSPNPNRNLSFEEFSRLSPEERFEKVKQTIEWAAKIYASDPNASFEAKQKYFRITKDGKFPNPNYIKDFPSFEFDQAKILVNELQAQKSTLEYRKVLNQDLAHQNLLKAEEQMKNLRASLATKQQRLASLKAERPETRIKATVERVGVKEANPKVLHSDPRTRYKTQMAVGYIGFLIGVAGTAYAATQLNLTDSPEATLMTHIDKAMAKIVQAKAATDAGWKELSR